MSTRRVSRLLLAGLAAVALAAPATTPAAAAARPPGSVPSRAVPPRSVPPELTKLSAALRAQARARAAIGARALHLKDSSFVTFNGWAFKIVGGAPLYVSDWRVFGGRKPVLALKDDEFFSLPLYPRDGTFVGASDGRVYRYVAGAPFHVASWSAFGSEHPAARVDARTIARAGEGWPWPPFDRTVDIDFAHYLTGGPGDTPQHPIVLSLNGSVFVRGAQTGRYYKMVSGAPLYVSTWDAFAGAHPAVTVDQAAIDHAGQSGVWRFVQKRPEDPWVINGAQTGQIYQLAGGAPLYLATPAALTLNEGGVYVRLIPSVVDQRVIDRGAQPAPYDNLRYYPADGTLLKSIDYSGHSNPSHLYRVNSGVPDLLPDNTVPDRSPEGLDQVTIDHAGQSGAWSHLRGPTD